VIIHGQVRNETRACIESVLSKFPSAEIIFSVSKLDLGMINFSIDNKVKLITYEDPGEFIHYGFYCRNFLRHSRGIYAGLMSTSKKYALKIRSDIIVKNVELPDIPQEANLSIDFFHHNGIATPIYVYPKFPKNNYFYSDMVIYGETKSLRLLFNNEDKEQFINLWNSSTLLDKIPSKNLTYLTPEELLYMSYLRKIMGNDLDPNDILCNKELVTFYGFLVKELKVDCLLPSRLDKYLNALNSKIFLRLFRNRLYGKIYKYLT